MKNSNAFKKENELLKSYQPKMRFVDGESFDIWQKRAYAKLWDLLGLDNFQKCDDELAI